MSELVTGDAVVLGLRPARVPTRALAVLVDLVVVWTLYVVLSVATLTAVSSLDPAAVTAVQAALFLLVLVGVPIAVETLSRGRSLGKLVCGLRVLREDGGPVRFRHCLVRGAIGLVEIQLSVGVIACIASLVSARGRRLGDVFAGTLVVRERVTSVRTGRTPPPPPWLVGSFTALDLSRVPEPLWLAVRQYLMRADQLDEAVGTAMGQRLAADLAAYTGAPAPGGVPPAAYLAGVLAERQGRDARRVSGPQRPGGDWGQGFSPASAAGPGASPHPPAEPSSRPPTQASDQPPTASDPSRRPADAAADVPPPPSPPHRSGGFVPPA